MNVPHKIPVSPAWNQEERQAVAQAINAELARIQAARPSTGRRTPARPPALSQKEDTLTELLIGVQDGTAESLQRSRIRFKEFIEV